MPPLKLMIAAPMLDRHGPDRVLLELLKNLPRNEFELSFAVGTRDGAYMSQIPEDVPIFDVPGGRYPVRGLVGIVRQVRPDILLTSQHMDFGAALGRPFFPKETVHAMRVATILSHHFDDVKKTGWIKGVIAKWITQLALRRADLVICQSQGMARDVMGLGAHPDRTAVINNPIDLHAAQHMSQQPGVPTLPGAPKLLAAGRLVALKGFDVLIDAMEVVVKSFPGAVLTILGEGEMRSALNEQARSKGISANLNLPGKTANPYAQMGQADLFICSSHYEGFSNVLIEAMACGTPVVATDAPGGNREIVGENEAGWLTPVGKSDEMAKTIVGALKSDLVAMRPRVKESCQTRFSTGKIVAQYALHLSGAARRRADRA